MSEPASASAGGTEAAPPQITDFKAHVEDWIDRAGVLMRGLEPADQAAFRPRFNEIAKTAMAALGDARGVELAGQSPQSALYRSALRAERPVLDGVEARVAPDRTGRLKDAILQEARAAGLDAEVIGQRIGAGAASALEEREWVKADLATVAVARGLDLGREPDRQAAAGIVDRFYEKAGSMIQEVRGLRVENAADQLRNTLTAMARTYERHGQVRFETDADALGLVEDMKARYGETVVGDLAKGRTDALAKDFADASQRATIAKAVTAAAIHHEPFGLSPREAQAAQERLKAEHDREQTSDGAPRRDRDLER